MNRNIFDDCLDYCCNKPRQKNALEKVRYEKPIYKTNYEINEKWFRFTKHEDRIKKCYFWKQSQIPLAKGKNYIDKSKIYKYI